jgi:hypothetical protein
MSSTNQVYVNGERLDLDDETKLLPTFQANDRGKPDTIQSDYSPEFSVPGTQRNHRLLGHGSSAQATAGIPYKRLPAVLVSSEVETMPLALLYIKGYQGGRYQLQLFAGFRRFVEALGDKKLSELDLSRLNHLWVTSNIAGALSYSYWETHGWGYEVIERGKEMNLAELNPYDLYPSVAVWLVWEQMLAEAGYTATDLKAEPIFPALNLPTAQPYTFPEPYRTARGLAAGWSYQEGGYLRHTSEFGPTTFPFNYTAERPYIAPTAASFVASRYVADDRGYYDLSASLEVFFGCQELLPGEVSMKISILVNGTSVGDVGEQREGKPIHTTLTAKASRVLLVTGDVVEVVYQGDEWSSFGFDPTDPFWVVGLYRDPWFLISHPYNPSITHIDTANKFTITMLEEFPESGMVKLSDWLPDMKQLDFFKSIVQLLGLTVQADPYEPHLYFSTGGRVLANTTRAKDWTAKRDAPLAPLGLPDRNTAYRFGEYAQRNLFQWREDEGVSPGFGEGALLVDDETLDAETTLVEMPYAASEPSPVLPALLRIRGWRRRDPNPAAPAEYDSLSPEPRLVLRPAGPALSVGLVTNPHREADVAPIIMPLTTTTSYFADAGAAFDLNAARTILPQFWPDLAAALKEARQLTEYYRLTPEDITELDFSIPIYDGSLGDYFLVSSIGEYDASRSTECVLVRLHPTLIPPPALGTGFEFYSAEFEGTESF